MGLGFQTNDIRKNVADFILGQGQLEEMRLQYKDTLLDIIPATANLRKQEDTIKKQGYPTNLLNALKQISHLYDYVIIDCPPAISTFSDIALIACDRYYVPLQAEYFSYEGLRNLASYIEELRQDKKLQAAIPNFQLTLGGIFAVGFNPNAKKNFNKLIVQNVQEQLGHQFLQSHIRTDIALSEAQAQGMHIYDYKELYKRGGKAAEDYHQLTQEIFNHLAS